MREHKQRLYLDGNIECTESIMGHVCNTDCSIITELFFDRTEAKLIVAMTDLFQNFNLRQVTFQHCSICSEGGCIIANFIAQSNLDTVEFWNCDVHDAWVVIMGAITRSSLRSLAVSYGSFDEEETMAFIDCIEKSSLIKLYLSENAFAPIASENASANAPTQSSIQSLILDRTDFPGINANETITNLIVHHCLTHLEIIDYHIEVEEITEIASAIKCNHAFKKIAFSSAPLHSEHSNIICDLIENSALTHIKLRNAALCDDQVASICASIKGSAIVSLDLESNCITAGGVKALCDLLVHGNLQKLNVSFNGLDDEVIRSMLPSIEKSSLIKFGMTSFFVASEDTKRRIEGILSVQKNILNRFAGTKSARQKN